LIVARSHPDRRATVLGAALLRGRKGHLPHRVLGWIWVACMAGVAGISFAPDAPPA